MIFFNKIKETETIEKERLQLWGDYQTYLKVEKSEGLKTYLTLKEKVESIPFKQKKKEIESLRFKGSPEEKMFKQFGKLEKNKKLISYFEVKASKDLERFNEIEKSGKLERLKELEAFIKKGQYKVALKAFNRKKKTDKEFAEVWENSDAFAKKTEFEELKSSTDVTFFKQFEKSKAYKNYLNVEGSTILNQFEDIQAEVNSERFINRKAYLEDVKRYEKTDDFKELTQFEQLDTNPEIQLYIKYNDTDAFKFFREWSPTYEENFNKLDENIWSFVTPIAESGPGRNFSVKNQLHYANNADNFDVENGILTLETKEEKVDGLYWDEEFGFLPKTFDYVSGIAHTLNGFKQEYGHFEIKVKASKVKGVISSVSLVDAEEDICIRILNSNGSNALGGLVTTNHQNKNFHSLKLKFPKKGYMIIALNWTPGKMEWSVNEKVMGEITTNVPHVPLGLRVETEVLKATGNLPHRIDIDWIKCYKKN